MDTSLQAKVYFFVPLLVKWEVNWILYPWLAKMLGNLRVNFKTVFVKGFFGCWIFNVKTLTDTFLFDKLFKFFL